MPVSEAKRKNNDNYNAKCDFIAIKPRKEKGEAIREAAVVAGQSLQGYILEAVADRMNKDAGQGGALPDLPPDLFQAVRDAAQAAGVTVDQWIIEAIKDKL